VSSAAPQPASDQRDVPSLLARLVDDAALFPPCNATVPDAVKLHLAGRSSDYADVLGLFLCPASRLPELITELIKVKPAKPVELSLVTFDAPDQASTLHDPNSEPWIRCSNTVAS